MEYRVLGRSGVKVAPLGLGTGNFADPTLEDEAASIINRAIDAGINLIDTGNSYSNGESEGIIGRALAAGKRRHEVILATKVFYRVGPGPNDEGLSRLHLIRACEDSLRRLQTDYIDLYQLHRPSPSIPFDETLGALTDLVQQGKVRYIGSSVHPAWKIMEAIMVSEMKGYARIVCEQPPYNLAGPTHRKRNCSHVPSPWVGANHLVALGAGCLGPGVMPVRLNCPRIRVARCAGGFIPNASQGRALKSATRWSVWPSVMAFPPPNWQHFG